MADIVIIKDRKGIKIGQIQLNLSETTVGLLKKEIRKISKKVLSFASSQMISFFSDG